MSANTEQRKLAAIMFTDMVGYQKNGVPIVLNHLRLDFLEPTTPVNMRLEGSVTQKSLARGAHQNVTF